MGINIIICSICGANLQGPGSSTETSSEGIPGLSFSVKTIFKIPPCKVCMEKEFERGKDEQSENEAIARCVSGN